MGMYTALQLNLKNINIQKDALNRFNVIRGEDAVYMPGKITSEDQWNIDVGDGRKEDLSKWLI